MKKNLLFNLIILSISIIITLTIIYLCRNNCFWEDDSNYTIITDFPTGIINSLNFQSEHGGGYFGLFLCKFFSFLLPLKFNIHPADFIGSPFLSVIKSLIVILILLLISRFTTFYTKSKAIFCTMYFFVATYLFYSVFSTESWIFASNYNFWRYCFSLIFFAYLIYYLFNILLKNKKPSKNSLCFASFSGYVIGTSSEILFFSCITFFCLIILYKLVTHRNILFNKYFYIPFLFLIISTVLFVSSWGFKYIYAQRVLSNLSLSLYTIVDFSKWYFTILFKNNFIYWIINTVLISISFIFLKKKNKDRIILPALLMFSILTVYYSLILCGGNGTYCGASWDIKSVCCPYSICHRNLKFLFNIIMFIPSCIYLSNLFLLNKFNKQNIYKILILFIGMGLCLTFYNIDTLKNENYVCNKFLKEYKLYLYKLEKIYRYSILSNIKPKIFFYEPYDYSWWYNPYDPSLQNQNCITNLQDYYIGIYNDINARTIGFEVDNKENFEIEYLKSLGGAFTKEEFANPKFQKLYDENFVLNNHLIIPPHSTRE